MSISNEQFEHLQALSLNRKVVTSDYTVRMGGASDEFAIDNPVVTDASAAATFTVTVPDGIVEGQQLLLVCGTAGADVEIAITNHANTDSTPTAKFDSAEEYLLLIWTGAEWDTVVYHGCSDVA